MYWAPKTRQTPSTVSLNLQMTLTGGYCETCWQCLPFNSHLLNERRAVVDFTGEEIEPQEGKVSCPRIQPRTVNVLL